MRTFLRIEFLHEQTLFPCRRADRLRRARRGRRPARDLDDPRPRRRTLRRAQGARAARRAPPAVTAVSRESTPRDSARLIEEHRRAQRAHRRSRLSHRQPIERMRVFEHDPASQRDPGRHLHVRRARLRLSGSICPPPSAVVSSRRGSARSSRCCDAVAEVLWLTREATVPTDEGAVGRLLSAQRRPERADESHPRAAARNAGFYPEVSAGQHRFTLRFLRWRSVDERPVQVNQDVRFLLAIC